MTSLLNPVISQNPNIERGALAIGCTEGRALPLASLRPRLASRIRKAVESRKWLAASGRRLTLSSEEDQLVVTLYGLGPFAKLEHTGLAAWLALVAEDCTATEERELTVVPPAHPILAAPAGAAAMLRQLALISYSFNDFRKAPAPVLRKLRLLPSSRAAAVFRRARKTAAATAHGVALARDLANTPPNRATPAWMASQARALGRRVGAKVRVFGPKDLERMKMGALLAVGQGSKNGPRMVRIDVGTEGPIIAVVGKGITFDTGGISIKPSPAMDEMKYDKAGACTAMGIAQSVAELGLKVRLRVYLPLAENMPDGAAYRPGDIVRTRSGKTVEVLNTDAEGRLVLADAISLALDDKPEALVEFSTLTGATVVALGFHGAALYSPDDRLARELLSASGESGERLWRMPLWAEFGEEMKGHHGDLRNLAGRWGGGNCAAAFLAEFMGDCPSWAHLDIAGTAWRSAEQGSAVGATGYGVASTVSWLLGRLSAG